MLKAISNFGYKDYQTIYLKLEKLLKHPRIGCGAYRAGFSQHR
jgi:hypothetical protein